MKRSHEKSASKVGIGQIADETFGLIFHDAWFTCTNGFPNDQSVSQDGHQANLCVKYRKCDHNCKVQVQIGLILAQTALIFYLMYEGWVF